MKRRHLYALVLLAASWGVAARPGGRTLPFAVRDDQLVGNVLGSVRDARTGKTVAGVKVLLLGSAWSGAARPPGGRGWLDVLGSSAVRTGVTDADGRFLINGVSTPYPYRRYTVVAVAPGYGVQVFDQVPVLPGAVMALECSVALTRGAQGPVVFHTGDPRAPYRYSHERSLRVPPPERGEDAAVASARIFSTREGLVGRSTANGHVIREGDRFVALPSRRALSRNGGREYEVKLTYRGRSVVAPVWDVGPWNIRDDHWNPAERREKWRDLDQGLPQAQAAFERGYNGGKDEFGRQVKNPAGIDLADGTFWRDLRMSDNDWITVEYLWAPGGFASSAPDRSPPRETRPSPAPRRSPAGRIGEVLERILRTARIVLEPSP